MTFNILAVGTVEQARAQVESAKPYDDNNKLFDRAKAFILAAFNDRPDPWLPEEWQRGVIIEASGYENDGVDSLKLTIRPLALPVAVAEKAGAAE